jgi:hypothetical protein
MLYCLPFFDLRIPITPWVSSKSSLLYVYGKRETTQIGNDHIAFTDYKNVFINEDLTKLRFKLFQMVRKCEEVKSASTRDGKIICYLQNGTKAVISSPDDLFKIGFQDVDYQKLGLAEL